MSENKLKARFQHAIKTESEWKTANPVLLRGEIAYSSDKKQWKTGNGTAKWSELTYDKADPTSHTHALSTMINTLSTDTATPTDEDYFISQYTGGGTTTTSYHRRPMKALWAYIQSKLHKVATSGSYNDLSNKPTIGNGTITIKQAGSSKGTFTLNQTGNTTIELTDNNTTYSTGTASVSGLTKLYAGTGTNADGTMTQAAIKSALDGKAANNHSHDSTYLKLSGGPVTGATSFTNTTASTSKSTGAVKVSGGVGVAGRLSANEVMIGDGCTIKFDNTNKCVNFVFS